jgi:hypothetical protein
MPRQAKSDLERSKDFTYSHPAAHNKLRSSLRPPHTLADSARMRGNAALKREKKARHQEDEQTQGAQKDREHFGTRGMGGDGNDLAEIGPDPKCDGAHGDISEIPLVCIDFTRNRASGAGSRKSGSERGSPATGATAYTNVPLLNIFDIFEGLEKLDSIILPAIRQGRCPAYFSRLDGEQGMDYEHGYRRIYDAYYGPDAIMLRKVGDLYEIVNGYRRIFVAAILGMESIPARVLEQSR